MTADSPGGRSLATRAAASRSHDQLERDLAEARSTLRTKVEELAASNEELLTANEELRAANEELDVWQEELRVLNEELTESNRQLSAKVEQLETVTADLRNLLGSTDVATIFLDSELCIRMFTPAVGAIFNLLARDVGRPLSDFQSRLRDERLLDEARTVFDSLAPREAEVTDDRGRWYLRRILPYRAEEDRVAGVVVTYFDVTAQKRVEQKLTELNAELECRVEERTAHVRLLQDVATIANTSDSPERAFEDALARVCDFNGWVLGHVYRIGARGDLVPGDIWYAREGSEAVTLACREHLGDMSLAAGEGLPGQVLASGAARWTGDRDTVDDPRVERLREAGVVAGVAFPVLARQEVVAVMECFSEHPVEPDETMLDIMANIGTQLGRVVERARAERRLAEVMEQEHQRLGEELHEGLGQQVTGLAGLARTLHQKLVEAGRPESELSGQLVVHFRAAREQVKRLAKGLMPVRIHERGLESALRELVDDVCGSYGVACGLSIDPLDVTDERLATSLYRIAREAMNNALLHARPESVEVRIFRRDRSIVLEVSDDGVGFPEDGAWTEGLGLAIMRDRAALVGGELTIEAREGGGTRVRCVIPEEASDGIR